MTQKTALVTGGASGIGEATARRLARDGYRVAVLDVQAAAAARVASDISGLALTVDVADSAAVDAAVADMVSQFGRIDACICSAGVLEKPTTVMASDEATERRIWDINYHGTVATCRAVGHVMQEQGSGAIVTLGSVNSFTALPLPGYCPSKTAILRMTEMLAIELGRFGIRVNGVAPTYVLTPALQAKIDTGERSADVIRGSSALGRFTYPDDIAAAIAFLCSDEARAITGVMLPVDSGQIPNVQYRGFAGGVPWD